jgi:hypothetical protein
MTIRDLLPMEIDIDVYDDVCEELAIAFCGPLKLTPEGEKRFGETLDYEIELNPHSYGGYPAYIIHIDDPEDSVWRHRLELALDLFESAAGYCSVDEYEKWFVDDP